MIRITLPSIDDYIYQLNDPSKANTDDTWREEEFNHVAYWGSARVHIIQIADIRLFYIDFNCKANCPVTVEVNSLLLMMNFTLSGQSVPGAGGRLSFCEAKHFSLFSPGHLKFSVTLHGNFKLFSVCFLENSLKRIIPGIHGQSSKIKGIPGDQLTLLQSDRLTTPQMNHIIQAIMGCIHKKGNHHIYLEAKALELLFLELEQVEQLLVQSPNSFLKEHDLERIYHAKIIVEENLLNPCSLIELAHKVGLNDFKLKKGFREVLGTTVFGYLYDLRMVKAMTLLTNGKSVREVAYEVGYKNAHHFTTAFKKKFGYLPSRIKSLYAEN